MPTPSATSPSNGHEPNVSGKAPKPRSLPPGFTEAKFQDFASQLQRLLGKPNLSIITSHSALDDGDYVTIHCLTHDMYNIYDQEEFIGCALEHPRNVTDVQAVVKLCNEFGAPLWVLS